MIIESLLNRLLKIFKQVSNFLPFKGYKKIKDFFEPKFELVKDTGLTHENIRDFFLECSGFKEEEWKLVSSAHSRIERIIITDDEIGVREYALDLLKNKSSHTEVWGYVYRERVFGRAINWIIKERSLAKSEWIQDHFLSFQHKDGSTMLLEPIFRNPTDFYNLTYEKDLEIASRNTELNIIANSFPFCFEGSNILIGDRFFFIGDDVVEKSTELFEKIEGLPQLIDNYGEKYFKGEAWSREDVVFDILIRILGSDLEPCLIQQKNFFSNVRDVLKKHSSGLGFLRSSIKKFNEHLDIFLTLGGENNNDEYIIFVGKPENFSPESDDYDSFFYDVEKWFCGFIRHIESLPTGKMSRKFKVVELPLVCYKEGLDWYIYSYNNSIVEIFDDTKRIVYPHYQVLKNNVNVLEGCNEEVDLILKDCGFEERIPFKGLENKMKNYGSIHCLTKDLFRS